MDPQEEREHRSLIIRALFDAEIAPWVRESPSYYVTSMEDKPEGLLVTLKARREDQVIHWLLGWGSRVRVIEPESLRGKIADEAKKIAANHRKRC
jgi:predicted DNA-binding transcriptional regulator YafY